MHTKSFNKHLLSAHKVWGAGRTELRGQDPSSDVRGIDIMRHLGQSPWAFLAILLPRGSILVSTQLLSRPRAPCTLQKAFSALGMPGIL